MTDAIDRPQKALFHRITFRFGIPEIVVRITNWESDLDLFLSVPTTEISMPKNTGTLGEQLAELQFKIDEGPQPLQDMLEGLSRGTPFPPVDVLIEERTDPAQFGDAATEQKPFRGRVLRAGRNLGGRKNFVRLQVQNEKASLDSPLGFPVNAHCPWRLFGPGCASQTAPTFGPQFATETKLGVVTAIDGKIITVAGSLDLGTDKTYTRGYLEFNNIKIGVQFYDKAAQDGMDPRELTLVRQAPVEWISSQIRLVPGCSKELDGEGSCRDAWANEEQFGGSGFAIPSYHPSLEDPQ